MIDHAAAELSSLVQKIRTNLQLKSIKLILLHASLEHHDAEEEKQFDAVIGRPVRQSALAKVISIAEHQS